MFHQSVRKGDSIFHYYWCDSSNITKNTNLLQDRFDKSPFTCETPTRFLRQKGNKPLRSITI